MSFPAYHVYAKGGLRDEESEAIRLGLHGNARTGAAPKFLFSGLLKCGCCGGNFVVINQTQYGCAVRKDRGAAVCNNALKVSRKVVEDRLLEGIKTELFTPEAVELFVKETQRLLTERQKKKTGSKDDLRKRLDRAEKEISNIMAAIKAVSLLRRARANWKRPRPKSETLKGRWPTPQAWTKWCPSCHVRRTSIKGSSMTWRTR